MSCGLELEKLQDFAKQLEEQSSTLVTQIQTLEAQLSQAKNSYLKVTTKSADPFRTEACDTSSSR